MVGVAGALQPRAVAGVGVHGDDAREKDPACSGESGGDRCCSRGTSQSLVRSGSEAVIPDIGFWTMLQ